MKSGVNCPNVFNQFRNGNYYVPNSIASSIKSLQAEVLRYPGGSLANFSNTFDGGYGHGEAGAKDNFISRFAYLLNQLDNPQVSYVANVYEPLLDATKIQLHIDSTLNALKKLPQIAYIEIGNEINISGDFMQVGDKPKFFESKSSYLSKVNLKAQKYIEVADRFIRAIRAEYPQVKIGLPFANYELNTLRSGEWNRTLRTYKNYDAEIYHIYLTTRTYLDTEYETKRIIGKATKPVWVTEWSWSHGMDGTKNLGDVNTLYYKYFFTDFPKICDKLGVEMICQHQLLGSNVYSKIKI